MGRKWELPENTLPILILFKMARTMINPREEKKDKVGRSDAGSKSFTII